MWVLWCWNKWHFKVNPPAIIFTLIRFPSSMDSLRSIYVLSSHNLSVVTESCLMGISPSNGSGPHLGITGCCPSDQHSSYVYTCSRDSGAKSLGAISEILACVIQALSCNHISRVEFTSGISAPLSSASQWWRQDFGSSPNITSCLPRCKHK